MALPVESGSVSVKSGEPVAVELSYSRKVTVPVGSTLHFRYLGEGGRWFDDESLTAPAGRDAAITV